MDGFVKIDTGQDGRSWQAFRERKSAFNSCVGRVVAKDTPTCLHTMYAENQTKWLSEYLQAELTIVSTSQTKHLIPCFQYEFDIQQYSTTPGGQC